MAGGVRKVDGRTITKGREYKMKGVCSCVRVCVRLLSCLPKNSVYIVLLGLVCVCVCVWCLVCAYVCARVAVPL